MLNTLSTHDSKRSQDVRCRLAVLSEISGEWAAAIADLESRHEGAAADITDRRYAYETMVGVWPTNGGLDDVFLRRIHEHQVKAAREAKRRSSWLDPDEAYEHALNGFAEQVLDDPRSRSVLESVVARIERAGVTNSLSAVVLRAAAPGVPDIYQGDDSWLLALVDPDNRRPVDFAGHHSALRRLPDADAAAKLLDDWRDGAIKQSVLQAALRTRRSSPDLFDHGEYLPLEAHGDGADHLVAFARHRDQQLAVVVAPRLPYRLTGAERFAIGDVWRGSTLDLHGLGNPVLIDALTGRSTAAEAGTLDLADVLRDLPVALLVAAES